MTRLTKEDLLVLLAVYETCGGSIKTSVSIQTVAKKLKKYRLYIRIKKSLRKTYSSGIYMGSSWKKSKWWSHLRNHQKGIQKLKEEKLIP